MENKISEKEEYERKLKYAINRFRNCVIRFYREKEESIFKEIIILSSRIMQPIVKELKSTYKKEDYKENNFILYDEPYTSLRKVPYKIEELSNSKLLKSIKKAIEYYDEKIKYNKGTPETRKNINLEEFDFFTVSFPNWWFNKRLSFEVSLKVKRYNVRTSYMP